MNIINYLDKVVKMRFHQSVHISQALIPVMQEMFWQWQLEHQREPVTHQSEQRESINV